MALEYLPARLRIRYYQQRSAELYESAREATYPKLKSILQKQAAIDAAEGRRLLFALIDGHHHQDYTGPL